MSIDQMSDDRYDIVDSLWKQSLWPLIRAGQVTEAADLLRNRIEAERTAGIRLELLLALSRVLMIAERDDEELAVIRQMIELAPDDPYCWGRLAGWYLYDRSFSSADPETQQAALDAIDKAVEKARTQKGDTRFFLNDRCRIVVAMKRYDLLEESLRAILETRGARGTQFEGDFLGRVPEKAVDPDLLAAYKELLAEQEARRTKRRSTTDES